MFGTNPRAPVERGDGTTLQVKEVFHTLQGEGPLAGTPSVFLRLAGCNLACWFCDTDFEGGERLTVAEVVSRVVVVSPVEDGLRTTNLVVITGGEPFRQNLQPLLTALRLRGFVAQVETAGTVFWDWIPEVFPERVGTASHTPWEYEHTIVCSPKTVVVRELQPYVHALKYIIRDGEVDRDDGLPVRSTQKEDAEYRVVRPGEMAGALFHPSRVFLQPMDEVLRLEEGATEDDSAVASVLRSRNLAASLCMKHGYRLSLQQHKILNLP